MQSGRNDQMSLFILQLNYKHLHSGLDVFLCASGWVEK